MKTDIAIDKLINIAPIIAELRPKLKTDEDFKKFIADNKENKLDNFDFVLKILPLFLRKYKQEIYEILSVISDKTVDEIANQSIGATISTIKELIADDDFKSFFINA